MILVANSPLCRPRLQERRQAKPDGPSRLMRRGIDGTFSNIRIFSINIRSLLSG